MWQTFCHTFVTSDFVHPEVRNFKHKIVRSKSLLLCCLDLVLVALRSNTTVKCVTKSLSQICHTEFSTFWSRENQKQYCFTEMGYYARPTCHLVLVWVTFEIQVTEILARIAGTKRPHPLSRLPYNINNSAADEIFYTLIWVDVDFYRWICWFYDNPEQLNVSFYPLNV